MRTWVPIFSFGRDLTHLLYRVSTSLAWKQHLLVRKKPLSKSMLLVRAVFKIRNFIFTTASAWPFDCNGISTWCGALPIARRKLQILGWWTGVHRRCAHILVHLGRKQMPEKTNSHSVWTTLNHHWSIRESISVHLKVISGYRKIISRHWNKWPVGVIRSFCWLGWMIWLGSQTRTVLRMSASMLGLMGGQPWFSVVLLHQYVSIFTKQVHRPST